MLSAADSKNQTVNTIVNQTRAILVQGLISQIFGQKHKPSQFTEQSTLEVTSYIGKLVDAIPGLSISTIALPSNRYVVRICVVSNNLQSEPNNDPNCAKDCAKEVGYVPSHPASREPSSSPPRAPTSKLAFIPDRLKNLGRILITNMVPTTFKVAASLVLNGKSFPYQTSGKCGHGCDLETSGTMYKTKAATSLSSFLPGSIKLPKGTRDLLAAVLSLHLELELYVIDQVKHSNPTTGDHNITVNYTTTETYSPRFISYSTPS